MNASAKTCPVCASPLRLYESPFEGEPYFLYYFAGEFIFWAVAAIVLALTWSFGDISYAIAVAVGALVVFAAFYKPWQRAQRDATARRGRYYCESCHHHFEGDALRQLTSVEPSK
jgi:hypothetical protein